jgi:hypothetical protein
MAKTLPRAGALKPKTPPKPSSPSREKKVSRAGNAKAPVRLPQRSEAVSGDESKVPTPIAAAQKKKPNSIRLGSKPRGS